MRVCVLTDTLADVNGVSRFIRHVADLSLRAGRDLHVVTATRLNAPTAPNIHVLPPRWSRPMPRYPQIELALPPDALGPLVESLRPNLLHLSTPGPVGWAGWRLARRLGIPAVGVYHTDFPAYVDRLMTPPVPALGPAVGRAFGTACAAVMARFYRPMRRVLTRSAAYVPAVERLGVDPARIIPLQPGIDTDRFHPRFRDPAVWARAGAPELATPGVNVLATTRVSVEKGMPLLVDAWRLLRARALTGPGKARLVVVGDGPYRPAMQAALAHHAPDAFFLGFRHGEELSRLYATADLFAFPSATDTLGQVVMEAQASGLPALVTTVGGPREVIDPGRTGQALPPGDARAWADALADLIADAPRRAAMAAAARARLAPMTIDASVEHYWRLHEEALGR